MIRNRQLTKYLNATVSVRSWLISSVTGKSVIYGMPSAIGIELTNNCNLRCPECHSGSGSMKRERGFMDPALFRGVMDELGEYLLNINLYFQGEPLLHPEFFVFLERSKDIFTTVSTNGHFLSAENCEKLAISGLKKLIISLDGIDQDTYSTYRINGDVEKVKEGIRNISKSKRESGSAINIEVQLLVNKYNEKQVHAVRKFAKECGATLRLKTMQILDGDDTWIPSDGRFSRYVSVNGKLQVKNKFPRRCARLWFNPVVTWDGRVVPCCFDKDADHVMGDLSTQSFRQIWHGARYKEFRNAVLTGREKIEICRNCTSGMTGKNT